MYILLLHPDSFIALTLFSFPRPDLIMGDEIKCEVPQTVWSLNIKLLNTKEWVKTLLVT